MGQPFRLIVLLTNQHSWIGHKGGVIEGGETLARAKFSLLYSEKIRCTWFVEMFASLIINAEKARW